MFQLEDQRDLLYETHHSPQKILFFVLLFSPMKWDPGLLQKLICAKRSGWKYEPFCKNTSKTALLADTNSCKMFRCYLQGNSLYFCSYTGAGIGVYREKTISTKIRKTRKKEKHTRPTANLAHCFCEAPLLPQGK